MKAYQKGICLAVATVMMAGCLTGCGEKSTIRTKEIGAGVSSPEKAAETYINGLINNGELLLTVVPEEYLEYLEDEYYLTKDQLKEKAGAYVYNENAGIEITSFEVVEKGNFRDMQDLNEALSEKGLDKSEEAYELEFEFQTEYGDGENTDDSCFEYNGKWYSWGAMERIEYVAENADDITIHVNNENTKACNSSEMAAEYYIRGCIEDSSFWFMAVPPEFIEYAEQRFGLTEKEIKEKVVNYFNEYNENENIKYFEGKVKNFSVSSCEYRSDESRYSNYMKKDLGKIGIIGYKYTDFYIAITSFNTDNGYNENDFGNSCQVFETKSGFYSYDAMCKIMVALNEEYHWQW